MNFGRIATGAKISFNGKFYEILLNSVHIQMINSIECVCVAAKFKCNAIQQTLPRIIAVYLYKKKKK